MTLAFFSDVGGGEMMVVGLVALLLFGKNLPKQARNLGRAITEFKRTINQAGEEIHREMAAAAEGVEEGVKDAAKNPAQDNPFPAIAQDLKSALGGNNPAAPLSDVAPQPGPVTAAYAPAAATPEPPRYAAATLSPSAALDDLARNLPPPRKIPPPVF